MATAKTRQTAGAFGEKPFVKEIAPVKGKEAK